MILPYSFANPGHITFHIPGAARSQRLNSTPSQSLGMGFQLVAEDRNQDRQEHIGADLMGAESSPSREDHRMLFSAG